MSVDRSATKLERLKKRADFLAAAKAHACARGAVLAQARDRHDGTAGVRVGFTATRRIGGAVERNRAKRRLREAARLTLPQHARAGCDYVLIARSGVIHRPWPRLLDDVKSALIRLAADLDAPPETPRPVVEQGQASAPPPTPPPEPGSASDAKR